MTCAGCPKTRWPGMEHCLNELNRRRRWYHFYMDEEGGVVAACDAVVAPGTAGPVGMELILRGWTRWTKATPF